MKKGKLGIEEKLTELQNSLSKALASEEIEDEDYEEEYEEETADDEEIEDPEMEKSEEYEEEIEEEVPEDDPEEENEEVEEDEEDEIEVDYEKLVDKLQESLNIDIINQRLDECDGTIEEIRNQLKDVVDIIGNQNDLVVDSVEQNETINKSLNNIQKNLDKYIKKRKSLKDITVIDKYDDENKIDVNSLSKAQKSTILANEIERGNTELTATDVSNAETSGFLSARAEQIIREIINK